MTYSGQGTLKPNLPEPDSHAIIYTARSAPKELSYTNPDGSVVSENLTKDPIRVNSERKDAEGTLHEASRLNYSKMYTVENYVKILNIGKVHHASMPSFVNNCMVRPREPPTPPRVLKNDNLRKKESHRS